MPQLCLEIASEPGVPVTKCFMRNTKKPHYLVKKELSTLWVTKYALTHKTRSQASVFSRVINTCENRIEVRTKW